MQNPVQEIARNELQKQGDSFCIGLKMGKRGISIFSYALGKKRDRC